MSITQFYKDVLGANLRNVQWSWGAIDPVNHRVYLRVWAHEIRPGPLGEEVQVYWKPEGSSPGYRERRAHLQAIQAGADGFGVVLTAAEPHRQPMTIVDFDQKRLLRLGAIRDDDRGMYAQIVDRVPVSDLTRAPSGESTLVPDLRTLIGRAKDSPTTVEALVDARVGQGAFRKAVLAAWDHRCALTGVRTLDALRASHIKPWRDSTDAERLDPQNGLPLVAHLDALFDAGLVTFDKAGGLAVSSRLSADERQRLGLTAGLRLARDVSVVTQAYLDHH